MTTDRTRPAAGSAPVLRFGAVLSQARRSRSQVLDEFVMAEQLGFTDFSTVAPPSADRPVLRAIAADVIPGLRAGRFLG